MSSEIYTKANLHPQITSLDHLLIIDYNFDANNGTKLGLFDLDSTLLKYYDSNIEKFEYMYPCIPNMLITLHSTGYKLFIVSNQSLANQSNEIEKIKKKIHKFVCDIKLPWLIFIVLGRNKYRKPCTGIYDYILKLIRVTPQNVFYVGDAAGPRPNCYSAYHDIKFAYNCKIKFYTPEQYFLNKKEKCYFKHFNVTDYLPEKLNITFVPKKSKYIFLYGTKKYSGVTTFIKKYYSDYTVTCTQDFHDKSIFVNCNDLTFINKIQKEASFYVLDYSKNILTWTKGFFYVSGMYYDNSFKPVKKYVLEQLKDMLINVPFIYDEENFTEEQRKIARLQLC